MDFTEKQLILLRAAWAFAKAQGTFNENMEEATDLDTDEVVATADEVEAIILKDPDELVG